MQRNGLIRKGIALGLFALLFSGDVLADEPFSGVSFYLDNDSRTLKPNHKTDRHYTNGTKIVYLFQPDWNWLNDFSDWDAAGSDESVDTVAGLFFGQNIYTPDHVDNPQKRKPKDMVFAGWLYTGLFAQRATQDKLDHIELSIGVIGPSSKAEQVQKCIHRMLGSDPPIGWEDQLSDEPAADLTYMRQERWLDGWLKPTEKTDVIVEYGVTAGSVHLNAQAGVTFRYGFNLGKTFGPGRLDLPSGISTLRKRDEVKSGYLFARASAIGVQYNRFLSGLQPEPLVGEFQVGAVYHYKKLDIGYSQTFLTREYKGQSGVDSYGSLTVSWLF